MKLHYWILLTLTVIAVFLFINSSSPDANKIGTPLTVSQNTPTSVPEQVKASPVSIKYKESSLKARLIQIEEPFYIDVRGLGDNYVNLTLRINTANSSIPSIAKMKVVNKNNENVQIRKVKIDGKNAINNSVLNTVTHNFNPILMHNGWSTDVDIEFSPTQAPSFDIHFGTDSSILRITNSSGIFTLDNGLARIITSGGAIHTDGRASLVDETGANWAGVANGYIYLNNGNGGVNTIFLDTVSGGTANCQLTVVSEIKSVIFCTRDSSKNRTMIFWAGMPRLDYIDNLTLGAGDLTLVKYNLINNQTVSAAQKFQSENITETAFSGLPDPNRIFTSAPWYVIWTQASTTNIGLVSVWNDTGQPEGINRIDFRPVGNNAFVSNDFALTPAARNFINFPNTFGFIKNTTESYPIAARRVFTAFNSVPTISNTNGTCTRDYSGETLACRPDHTVVFGQIATTVTPNTNVTNWYVTSENYTLGTDRKIFVYNKTGGGSLASTDLWFAISNESGGWVYFNPSGITPRGCSTNGTSISAGTCNLTGVYGQSGKWQLHLIMQGTQALTITNSSIPQPEALTVTLNTPTNGFINTTFGGGTPFNFTPLLTGNATAFYLNASLWNNKTGTFGLQVVNTSPVVNNTANFIVDSLGDGTYIWNVRVCADNAGPSCAFGLSNFTYTVRTTPQYYNITINLSSPQTFGNVNNITFNITWTDSFGNFNVSLIEHNFTGATRNYSMENRTPTIFGYFLAARPAAGNYTYRFYGNDSVGNSNSTEQFNYTVNKRSTNIQITSSQGFSFTVGPSTTIQATADSLAGTPTLQVNGITVSNPTTQTFAIGNQNVTAFISNTQNFSDTSLTRTIVVNPLSQCTSDKTFAFRQLVTGTGAIQSFNFTSFVNSSQVRIDLGDVYSPNITDISLITTNITAQNKILNVNTTGLNNTVYHLQWGNYFARRIYSSGTSNGTILTPVATQINPYLNVRLLNETDFQPLHPPNATNTIFIECSLGESVIPIESGNHTFLIATNNFTDRILIQVKYSADSFYSRQLLPNATDVVAANLYVVDAFEFAVDRIDFIMASPTYYNSKLVVYKNVGGQQIVITEGNFDASRLFSAFLREDARYNIKAVLDNTVKEFGEILVVAPATKVLGDIKVPLTSQTKIISEEIVMQAFMNSNRTILTTQYVDDLSETTSVTITIRHENGTVFQNNTYLADEVTATFNTSCCTNQSFTVQFSVIHERFGNSPLLHTVSLFPGGIFFDLGIGTLILQLATLILSLMIGGLATRETLVGASISISLVVLISTAVGWFPSSPELIVFMILLLVFGIAVSTKKSGEE